MQKNEAGPLLDTIQYNFASKWITDANIGAKSIKLSKETEKKTHRMKENNYNKLSNKGLLSRIHKEILQLNVKR